MIQGTYGAGGYGQGEYNQGEVFAPLIPPVIPPVPKPIPPQAIIMNPKDFFGGWTCVDETLYAMMRHEVPGVTSGEAK